MRLVFSRRPIATAWAMALRVVGLLVFDTGEHREGSDTSAAKQGAMAVWPQRRLLSVRHATYVVSSQLPTRLLLDVGK